MQVYFTALVITIAVEFLVYLLFIRSKILKVFIFSVVINCFTHPAAFYIYSIISEKYSLYDNFNIYFIIIELIVFLAEIIFIQLLFQLNLKKAILISFTANLVTALLSFII